jgi:hypothetical protein
MAPKPRTEIPPDVSAQILFEHDHACCVCNMRGLAVQIHHIDDDPTNHDKLNLAVLCLEDHNRTLIRGGFGRRLTPGEVLLYRDDWIRRVSDRRRAAAEFVQSLDVNHSKPSEAVSRLWERPFDNEIIGYVLALPLVRRAAYVAAKPRWDSGIGSEMRDATYQLIDILENILVRLSSFYPPNQFGCPAPEYFASHVESRFRWHRLIYEPDGPGTGGTMMGEIVAGNVAADLESLVEQIVEGLYVGYYLDTFDVAQWRAEWSQASDLS